MLKHILTSAFVGSLYKCKWFTLYFTTGRQQRVLCQKLAGGNVDIVLFKSPGFVGFK
jgi:hypothetical protein